MVGNTPRFPEDLASTYSAFACIAAVLFTLPAALLARRYLRGTNRWFRIHVGFNTATVLLLILVGMSAVSASRLGRQFLGPNSDRHHKVGPAVLSKVLMQAIIGVAAHYTHAGPFLRREMNAAQTQTPGVQIIFWALFLVSADAYGIAVGNSASTGLAANTIGSSYNTFYSRNASLSCGA